MRVKRWRGNQGRRTLTGRREHGSFSQGRFSTKGLFSLRPEWGCLWVEARRGMVAGEQKDSEVTVRLTLCFRWSELVLPESETLRAGKES